MPKSKPRRPNPPHLRLLDVLDEAAQSCRKIAALGALLAHCEIEALEPTTISVSGALIADETRKLHEGLKMLGQMGRSKPPSR